MSCRRIVRGLVLPTAAVAVFAFGILADTSCAAGRHEIFCKRLSAVDGDTIKCDGVNMRDMGDGEPFKSGYDTPEIGKAKCAAEKALGYDAKKRMAQLLKTPGMKIFDSGDTDARNGRPFVWVILPDGRSAGSVLIAEGLAKPWSPGHSPDWCSRPA